MYPIAHGENLSVLPVVINYFIYLSHVNKHNKILCFIAVKITTQVLVFTGYLIMEWCGGPAPFDDKF